MRSILSVLLIIFCFAFAPIKANSQDVTTESYLRRTQSQVTRTSGSPEAQGPTGAPFDGGISLLVAAGLGYAGKKAHDKRKKEKANNNI